VKNLKERKEKKKSNKPVTYGFIGLIAIMSILIILFNLDLNEEPKFLVDVISDDPYNYLEKRTNLKDGSVNWHFNYTERMGSKSYP